MHALVPRPAAALAAVDGRRLRVLSLALRGACGVAAAEGGDHLLRSLAEEREHLLVERRQRRVVARLGVPPDEVGERLVEGRRDGVQRVGLLAGDGVVAAVVIRVRVERVRRLVELGLVRA